MRGMIRFLLAILFGFYLVACATSGDTGAPSDDLASEDFGAFDSDVAEGGGDDSGDLGSLDSDSDAGGDDFLSDAAPEEDSFSENFGAGNQALEGEFADLSDEFGEGVADPGANEGDIGGDLAAGDIAPEGGDDLGFDDAAFDEFGDVAPLEDAPAAGGDDDFFAELDEAPTTDQAPQADAALPPALDEDIFAELEGPEVTPPPPAVGDVFPDEPMTPMAKITNIEYKTAGDTGGTIVIKADGPIKFESRTNSDLNQYVIEIPNARLPSHLQRPFDTSEFEGNIGAIQAYQDPGSTVARVIVQLRDGAAIPTIEQEGNSLLVMTPSSSPSQGSSMQDVANTAPFDPVVDEPMRGNENILAARSLEEFLNGNTKFYGKKISIETSESMQLRDLFRLISEEADINLVIDEQVKGEVGLLKLRQVPWDQALHMIFKANNLGYSRHGNVLRIARLDELRKEEAEVQKLKASRQVVEPLKVQMIPISYAKMADMEKQVKEFLTERGKVVGDPRTSALLVTDVEENLAKVAKLVKSLDVAPPQVLIEGKIVEATEAFTRRLGVDWRINNINATGSGFGTNGLRGNVSVMPPDFASIFSFDLSMGTFEGIGDLSTRLLLSERNDEAKVISSPRIVTLHNETALINQVQEIPLITTDENNRRTVQFKPVGLQLEVLPQITTDESVILGVNVMREFAGPTIDNETQARAVNKRSAKTRVLVRNGDTAVIGGIYQNSAVKSDEGVPLLKDIPFLGALFRASSSDTERTELLIFLTPRILGDAGDATLESSLN